MKKRNFEKKKRENHFLYSIYNIKGQKVRTLLKGRYEKGENSVVWKGYNDAGKKVSSGIYFYELITSNKRISKKMLLLK